MYRQHERYFLHPRSENKKSPGESMKAMRISQGREKGLISNTHAMLTGEAEIWRVCVEANLQ